MQESNDGSAARPGSILASVFDSASIYIAHSPTSDPTTATLSQPTLTTSVSAPDSSFTVTAPLQATASSSSPGRKTPPRLSPAAHKGHSKRNSTGFSERWPRSANGNGQAGPPAVASVDPDSLFLQDSHHSSHTEANFKLEHSQGTGKRTSPQAKSYCAMDSATPAKKARTGASPPRKFEIPPEATVPLSSAVHRAHRENPISPLFFSHTPSRHFTRAPGSAVSDAAVKLMSHGRDETAESVTTLKLPRANVSSTSTTGSSSTPGSLRSSMDLSIPSVSPDVRAMLPGMQALQNIGVIELLEFDDRPTFLIDLASAANTTRFGLPIVYYNASLRSSHEIHQLVVPDQGSSSNSNVYSDDFGQFRSWALSPANTLEGVVVPPSYFEYGGVTWTCTTLRRRFKFISCNVSHLTTRKGSPLPITDELVPIEEGDDDCLSMQATPSADVVESPDYFGDAVQLPSMDGVSMQGNLAVDPEFGTGSKCHPDDFTNHVLQSQRTSPSFDWTRIPMDDDLPDHIKFAKSVDWTSTRLGPIEDWPSNLRAMANLIMASPHPASLYWGPHFVTIYNSAYISLAGQKHPLLMGQRYIDAWAEIWGALEPIFKSAWESGQATMKHDDQLFLDRNGYKEETFFSWSIIPLLGADGQVTGLYNPCFENTRRKINERRMLTLREIGERTATATSVQGFWPQVQKGLEYNEFDVPFSLIYSVKDEMESDVSSLHSGSVMHSPQLILEGSPGVPDGHQAAPYTLDLRTSEEAFAPYMRQSLTSGGTPVVLSEEDGTLPKHLIEGFQWRGFGDPCKTIVVFPIVPTTTAEAVAGFIVLGVNPRRPYDGDYTLFIHLLSRQLATSMASVVLFEEEIRRGQRAAQLAAMDRQELSLQLLQRTEEANELELKFTRMTEFAPVGMFIADAYGHINYRNDMWWQISRRSRSEEISDEWMEGIRSEDRPALEAAWTRLLEQKVTISVEFRFNCSQELGDNTVDTWVLLSAFPEKYQDGSLKSIFGCITDISSQKWAEKVQSERREEAVELKRQQENFIDITSHEMRNPLSAILQCVDQIANSISSFAAHSDKGEVETLLEGCLDAANTINLCATHQKRIVDDILTLSKLDSSLLAVTPIDEQPVRVVHRTLKMFEAELIAHDIELEFLVDDSFEALGIKWAKLDPSRLRQILINLMTNAIKFTQGRDRRNIIVKLHASRNISEVTSQGVFYFERNDTQRTAGMDIDSEAEWGTGELINIHCSVEDTGPGLAEEEMKILFQRFQQATPRTHVQYGGSGLGLFISRILTEMQGGQIGVSSRRDIGSKFNFYIKSRKCINPPADYEHISPFKIGRKANCPATTTVPAIMSSSPAPTQSDVGSQSLFDVLIVEDNIVNQRVLQRQLRNCGNNTFVANHGREALQTLERSRFWLGQETDGVDISVILMDLEMPVMDGMTCARRIRELEREGTIVKHIPIIAVTAYARPEQIANAKAAGIDDVISKPFRIPELMPKIEELVGKYQRLSVTAEA